MVKGVCYEKQKTFLPPLLLWSYFRNGTKTKITKDAPIVFTTYGIMRVESSVPDLEMKNKYVFLIISHCYKERGFGHTRAKV